MLIIQSTRDDKMAYAGLSRERKVKRFVQGMRRPKAHMKENALEAWKVSGPAHEEE